MLGFMKWFTIIKHLLRVKFYLYFMDISWNIQSFNIVHVKKNDITKRISLIFLYKNLFLFPFFIYNLILQLHVYVINIHFLSRKISFEEGRGKMNFTVIQRWTIQLTGNITCELSIYVHNLIVRIVTLSILNIICLSTILLYRDWKNL